MKQCIVYGLYSSRDDELRYIGQTINRLSLRLSAHISVSKHKAKSPVHFWIRREMVDGYCIKAIPLLDNGIFNTTEQELIEKYRNNGSRLLNITSGGAGQFGFKQTEEHIRKRSYSHIGLKHTEQTKQKMRDAKVGRKLTNEHKLKISNSLLGRLLTSEHSAKISAALTGKSKGVGRVVSDETRALISQVKFKYWADRRQSAKT